jgi:hypothetical protein
LVPGAQTSGHVAVLDADRPTDAGAFAEQARFFVTDDFHRQMLERQLTGLAYYLLHAADPFRDAA